MSAAPVGAYGLRVSGLDGSGAWLAPVPEHFPALHLTFGEGRRPDPAGVTATRVVVDLGRERSLVVDRGHDSVARATCWDVRPPQPSEWIHPLLTATSAVAGAWSGYDSFHAAAVVGPGGVWALLGDKESGKSTLAAAMAARGHSVVCDDMLALRGRTAFAGPRCVDLRTDAAARLGMGEDLGTEGPRPRWRVGLPPIQAELPLAGWVILGRGGRVGCRRLAPRDLLVRLGCHQTWPQVPIRASALLDLATLPAWELTGPRRWSSLASVVTALETAIG